MSSWNPLGAAPPGDLTETRLELHHAVQLVSIAVGRALVPHRDDDSHTALGWLHDARQWIGEAIPGADGWRAGLRPSDLTLTLGREPRVAERELALAGKTLDDGLAWLREELAGLGLDAAAVAFDFHYEMPPHPVADGAAFRGRPAVSYEELGRWFANGVRLLERLAAGRENASEILTWPHHFDVGMLLPRDEESGVGVGLSPGDDSYDEPYLYVNVWPRPRAAELPRLPRGHWHSEGFFAAILTATELLDGDRDAQEDRAEEFLSAAVDGGFALLD